MDSLKPSDVDAYIPKSTRLAMIELIMAWARVDSMIAQLTAASFGLSPTSGAILMANVSVSSRISKIIELNRQLGRHDQVKPLRQLRKDYDKHVVYRNRIAHGACMGVLRREPKRLVFSLFEAADRYGNLTLEGIHLTKIKEATHWAKEVERRTLKMLDEVDFYRERRPSPSSGAKPVEADE